MKKLTRTKVLIAKIEAEIEKNQNHIAALSENNFKLRTALTHLQELPTGKTITKADLDLRDKDNKIGKFWDQAYQDEQIQKRKEEREAAAKAAEAKAAEETPEPSAGGTI